MRTLEWRRKTQRSNSSFRGENNFEVDWILTWTSIFGTTIAIKECVVAKKYYTL